MGKRPAKNRVDQFQLRVLPEEVDAWRRAAEIEGLPISGWLRQLANREARRSAGDQAVLTGGAQS